MLLDFSFSTHVSSSKALTLNLGFSQHRGFRAYDSGFQVKFPGSANENTKLLRFEFKKNKKTYIFSIKRFKYYPGHTYTEKILATLLQKESKPKSTDIVKGLVWN